MSKASSLSAPEPYFGTHAPNGWLGSRVSHGPSGVCRVHPRTTCVAALLSRSTNTKTTGVPDNDALTRRATGSSAPPTEELKKSPTRPSMIAPMIAPGGRAAREAVGVRAIEDARQDTRRGAEQG